MRSAYRLISTLVRIHPRLFLTAVAGAAVFALCTVASSFGVRWMVDQVILPRFRDGQTDTRALAIGAGLVIGIGLLRAVGVVVRRSFAGMAHWRTAETISLTVLQQIVRRGRPWRETWGPTDG